MGERCCLAGGAAAGMLAVLAMLEAGGLVPVSVTTRRATFLVYQYVPVTGSWLLDAAAVSLLGLVALRCGARMGPGAALGYLVAGLALGPLLAAAPPAVGPLAVSALAVSTAVRAARALLEESCGWRGLALGAGLAIVVVEAALVSAIGAYYVDPSLAWAVQRVLLVERRLWAAAMVSAPFLAAMFGLLWLCCLVARLLGKDRVCPLRPQPPSPGAGRGLGRSGVALAAALAVAAVLLPHLPSVNPDGRPVSVDTFYYARFLEAADKYGLCWALRETHGLARAGYLALLYAIHKVTGLDPYVLMDVVHPLVAGLGLAATAYLVAERRLGCCGGEAAVLAVTGGQFATFLLSGLQANSVALPLALLYLVSGGARLAALMAMAALIHPWTHVVYATALVYDKLWIGDRRGAASAAVLAAAAIIASDAVNRVLAASPAATLVVRPLAGGIERAEPLAGAFYGSLLWSWGSLTTSPWVMAAGAAAPFYTPAAAAEAVAASPSLLLYRVIAHRLLLDVPFWLPAALLLQRLPWELRYPLLVAAAAGLMAAAYYAVPLEGPLWEGIWTRLVNP